MKLKSFSVMVTISIVCRDLESLNIFNKRKFLNFASGVTSSSKGTCKIVSLANFWNKFGHPLRPLFSVNTSLKDMVHKEVVKPFLSPIFNFGPLIAQKMKLINMAVYIQFLLF